MPTASLAPRRPARLGPIARLALSTPPSAATVYLSAAFMPFVSDSVLGGTSRPMSVASWLHGTGFFLGEGLFLIAPAWLFVVAPFITYTTFDLRRLWGWRGLAWATVLGLGWTVVMTAAFTALTGSGTTYMLRFGVQTGLPIAICCITGIGLMARWASRLDRIRVRWFCVVCVAFAGGATGAAMLLHLVWTPMVLWASWCDSLCWGMWADSYEIRC